MKSDIPLKRLTALRGADFLPLLGFPDATLVEVVSRELPTSAKRLDTLLRLRSPRGQHFLHLLEWQNYPDPLILWRTVGYLAWIGQHEPDTSVLGTIAYLHPAADMGDSLIQQIDGQIVRNWQIGSIRVWEQDAQAALATKNIGLAVLSPLMQNTSPSLIETAAQIVLAHAPAPQQSDLLSILGVFAEPLYDVHRFTNFIGRDRLMSSGLFEYLMQEREAEWQEREAEWQEREAEWQEREAEWQEREAELRQQKEAAQREAIRSLQQILMETILLRFPTAPIALTRDIQRVQQSDALSRLIIAVQQAPDVDRVVELLREAAG